MHRIIISLFVLIIAVCPQVQAINQAGIAYRYNGSMDPTPLGNVRIKPMASSNYFFSDSLSGAFTLILSNLSMGSRIGQVNVAKRGMMVFNQGEVDQWSVRRDPVRLILCDVGEFQRQKNALRAEGERRATQRCRATIDSLTRQLEAQRLQTNQYYAKCDSVEEAYRNVIQNMDAYADVFARINENEIDSTAQRAVELFKRGDFENAIRLFESADYLDKLDKAIQTKRHAQELRVVTDSVRTLAENDIEESRKNLNAQIAAYKLSNNWLKAGELLKNIADRTGELEDLFEYAYFRYDQKDYGESEVYFLSCKNMLGNSPVSDTNNYYLAATLNNLALLYSNTQRYAESEQMYMSALEFQQRLANLNPQAFESDLAMTLNNLGSLYYQTQRYSESEQMYMSALDIRQRLANLNPQAFESDLASTLNNLALLYSNTQRHAESEQMYRSALEIRQRLANLNPQAFEPDLASTLNNLAILYSDTQRYAESEQMYMSALEIRQRLANLNPQAFESDLASTLNNLAVLYSDTQRFSESEQMYRSALEIRQRLANLNPQAFEPDLASTLLNLGSLYYKTHRYSESEQMYMSALQIQQRLANLNPQAFEPDLASTLNNLGSLYYQTQRYSESEQMYMSALQIRQRLANEISSHYRYSYIMTRVILNQIYSDTGCYSTAYSFNKETLTIIKNYYSTNPDNWETLYATTLNSQSFYSNLTAHFAEGERYAREALHIDSTKKIAFTNLAAALLLQGKVSEAEPLYRQYKQELKTGFLKDFAKFERLNLIPEERKAVVEHIKAILND